MAKELGWPAKITFRRSGNRFTVEPACSKKTAAGSAAGEKAAAQTTGGGGGGRGTGPRRLEDKAPSEMSLEVNILRYLVNCLERRHGLAEGEVVPVSPTQPEERTLGFDAVVGLPRGRYAALQFKRPEKACHDARFEMGDRQALTLLRYPRGSALYVLPPALTNGEMAGLGRCLLHEARMVDAWDVLAAVSRSRRAAGAGAAACGDGGKRGAGFECDYIAYVDGGDGEKRGAVRVRAGGGDSPYFEVPSRPASSLCDGADDIGFDVRDGRMETRRGAKWDCCGWRAEAGRSLGAPIGRTYRRSGGRWEADESAAVATVAADDGPGRPGVDEAESRFWHACGRDGQDEDGDGDGPTGSG